MNISPETLIGLGLILIVLFSFWGRDNPKRAFRSIKSFSELQRDIELSVEDGSRLQIGLGPSGLLGPQSAAAFAGLTLLRQVAEIASDSDQPPIATTGDGALMLLAQDTLRSNYRRLGIRDQYHARLARVTGLTPFSHAAGALPLILDRSVLGSALVGSFGNEVGLISDASQRTGGFTIGGSDQISSQAILFASAEQPLIGEELYASGAYTGAGPAHQASLRAQDALRWLIIILLTITALMPLFGGSQ
ncbi:MAG: DUF6754 domain-containing protein [Anaerolineales bacterium]